jgi:protein DGCR14
VKTDEKEDAMKRKTIVLEEEEYMKNLEAIVLRDYFPDLGKLQVYKSQADNTLLNKHTGQAKEIIEKSEDKAIDISNMTLDEYLHKYTSEDNKSFEKLFEKQKEKEAKKYAWMERQAELANARTLALQQANNTVVKSIEWNRDRHINFDTQFTLCDAKSSLFFGPKVLLPLILLGHSSKCCSESGTADGRGFCSTA